MLFLFFFSVLMVVNAELSKTNEINNYHNHKAMPMKATWKDVIDKLKTFACLFSSDSNCRTNIENGLMEIKRYHYRNDKYGVMEKIPEVIFDAIFWVLLFGWLIFKWTNWTWTILHQPNVDFVPLADLIELY